LPLLPDLGSEETVTDLADRGVQWICQTLFPSWVYRLFRLEGSGSGDLATVIRGNSRLYQLMNHLRERRQRLGRIFTRGLALDHHGPVLFGGCYLAGTGGDEASAQAFVPGIFRRLLENQNYVSWTDEALQEETDYEHWTRYGYIGLGVALSLLMIAGLACWSVK